MTAIAEKIRIDLSSLNDAERAELAHYLIRSLDAETDADAESAWDVELERRAKEIRDGKASGEPAEKVFSDLRAKYS